MEPLFLQPAYKDYLWGGDALKKRFHKTTSLTPLAESWELSCHPAGESLIQNGPFAGKRLTEYLRAFPDAVCDRPEQFDRFPLLVKLIDAKQDLSIQVHPNDAYAREYEGEPGKTEMWYVIDCELGAELICGIEREVSKVTFEKAILDGSLPKFAHKVTVRPGDVFLIPAGTLHAIGAGILIAEVQQNSDSTYRVYDYGRLGKDGTPRPLHVKKAVDVTNLRPAINCIPVHELTEGDGYEVELLAQCDYFLCNKVSVQTSYSQRLSSRSFVHLLVLEAGDSSYLQLNAVHYPICTGDSIFLPANKISYKLIGKCCCLQTTLP